MSLLDALDRIRLNSFAISKGKSLAKIRELEGIIKELEDKLRLTTVGQWHFKSERDIHVKESEQFVVEATKKIQQKDAEIAWLKLENQKLVEAFEHLDRELNNGQALEPGGPNHGYIKMTIRKYNVLLKNFESGGTPTDKLSKRVHELEKGIDNILAGEAYYMAKPHKVYDIFEELKKLMTDDSKPE